MKSLTRIFTITCLIITCAFGCFSSCFAVEDAIIAVVNDQLITLKDLKDYMQSTYASLIASGEKESRIQEILEDLQKNGIQKLIEDKLILSAANTLGLEVRSQLVDERIAGLKEKYGSEQNLVDALVNTGATLTDLRNKILDDMKINFIIEHEIKSKIYINPQEVTEYYENHKQAFGTKDRVNLESIFIPYNDDKDAARLKAEEALKQIREGGDFKEAAETYSEAPSVGIIERGQLLPEIEEVVFHLKTDEVSPAIETDNGLYIFKLTGKVQAEIPELVNVKETIQSQLYKEKFKERFTKWIEKLKKDAYIEIK
jgi:foldase protein PrsA